MIFGGNYKKNKPKSEGQRAAKMNDRRKIIGDNLSFSAAEAYKLLRTNLMFSMADEDGCKVIGVTSSLRGEGKSTTALNLAYSLTQISNKVLLLEADMRIPTVADVLELDKGPGLSQVLAGIAEPKDATYRSRIMPSLFVLPSGEIPPNPVELLGSEKMKRLMEALKHSFEYIVVDLPPVNAVSDGLTMSELLAGMIVVVREEYCDQASLAEAMRRMALMQVKILGFVMTDAKTDEKGYKKYGRGYGYS